MKTSAPCKCHLSVLFVLIPSLLAAGSGVASAADLSAKAYQTTPPPAAIYNWTGFYIGGFGGYASEIPGNPKMEGDFAGGTRSGPSPVHNV
ncbi:hypothetical protein ACFSQQ_16035 [Mesorhizobium kowhaii]|uniref:hypothetical protein n=1 Tax=Mesorhizobium kowhaii TaxID=1300272 RepID=UPI0035EAB27A